MFSDAALLAAFTAIIEHARQNASEPVVRVGGDNRFVLKDIKGADLWRGQIGHLIEGLTHPDKILPMEDDDLDLDGEEIALESAMLSFTSLTLSAEARLAAFRAIAKCVDGGEEPGRLTLFDKDNKRPRSTIVLHKRAFVETEAWLLDRTVRGDGSTVFVFAEDLTWAWDGAAPDQRWCISGPDGAVIYGRVDEMTLQQEGNVTVWSALWAIPRKLSRDWATTWRSALMVMGADCSLRSSAAVWSKLAIARTVTTCASRSPRLSKEYVRRHPFLKPGDLTAFEVTLQWIGELEQIRDLVPRYQAHFAELADHAVEYALLLRALGRDVPGPAVETAEDVVMVSLKHDYLAFARKHLSEGEVLVLVRDAWKRLYLKSLTEPPSTAHA